MAFNSESRVGLTQQGAAPLGNELLTYYTLCVGVPLFLGVQSLIF